MDEYVSLNNSWFGRLTNPNHDGITQQVDDSVMAFVTDNALFIERRNALHRCREHEDEVIVSILTAALTALGTTSCMGYGPIAL